MRADEDGKPFASTSVPPCMDVPVRLACVRWEGPNSKRVSSKAYALISACQDLTNGDIPHCSIESTNINLGCAGTGAMGMIARSIGCIVGVLLAVRRFSRRDLVRLAK